MTYKFKILNSKAIMIDKLKILSGIMGIIFGIANT